MQAPLNHNASSPHHTTSAVTVLVVEPVLDDLLRTVAILSSAGFLVTAAATFAQAKPLLTAGSPAVLLTAARLGMYNGLHLVVRGTALQPGLAALITSRVEDLVLQRETEQLGATFILQPLPHDELIASILKTRFRAAGNTEPIRPPFERRSTQRRALEPIEPISVDRRGSDRRRMLPWLVPPPGQSSRSS
jgi:DNA-binding NtrC family response regulator